MASIKNSVGSTGPDCGSGGEPGPVPDSTNKSIRNKSNQPPESSRKQNSLPESGRGQKSSRSYSRHSIHGVIRPHVSQTAAQRPDEQLIKHQYKKQLQKQIDERRRLKEERICLEKQEEEKLRARVEQDRNKMAIEEQEDLERKRIRQEAIKQREELTLKQIEASRQKAEEERRRRMEEKRHSLPETAAGGQELGNKSLAAEFDMSKSSVESPDWRNLTYLNPHDEQIIKPKRMDLNKLLDTSSDALVLPKQESESEHDQEDDDAIDENSLSTFYERDELKTPTHFGADDDDFGLDTDKDSLPLSCVSSARHAKAKPKTKLKYPTPAAQTFLKKLKVALALEEERMRIIISRRAAAVSDSDFGTEAVKVEEERICDCNLTDEILSSSDADTIA